MTAAMALALDHSTREALQRHAHHHLTSNVSEFSHSVIPFPSSHPKDVTEDDLNSTQTNSQFRENFPQLFADTLRRRLYPNSNLHIKQLAYAVRRSEATVYSWLAGNRSPRGEDLMECITFFGAAFASELLASTGCMVVRLDDRRAAALQKIAAGMAELKAMES